MALVIVKVQLKTALDQRNLFATAYRSTIKYHLINAFTKGADKEGKMKVLPLRDNMSAILSWIEIMAILPLSIGDDGARSRGTSRDNNIVIFPHKKFDDQRNVIMTKCGRARFDGVRGWMDHFRLGGGLGSLGWRGYRQSIREVDLVLVVGWGGWMGMNHLLFAFPPA